MKSWIHFPVTVTKAQTRIFIWRYSVNGYLERVIQLPLSLSSVTIWNTFNGHAYYYYEADSKRKLTLWLNSFFIRNGELESGANKSFNKYVYFIIRFWYTAQLTSGIRPISSGFNGSTSASKTFEGFSRFQRISVNTSLA